jgi:hypothetical protein
MCKIKHLNPPRNHELFWEEEVMAKLGEQYPNSSYEELAEMFGRTKSAVQSRICVLRVAIRMVPYKDRISPVMIKKHSEGQRRRAETEEGKTNLKKMAERRKSPEIVEKHKKSMRNPNTRALLSESRKGNKNRLGCKHSEESKQKQSASIKAAWAKRKAEHK